MVEPRALLDSNICIYLIEGLSETARARVESFGPGEVVTSAIAYAEVMRGVNQQDARACANAAAFFEAIPVLPFGPEAALSVRTLRFVRHRFDHLIAAHALSLGVVLVTRNIRHFAKVPGLDVQNWTAT